MSISRALSLAWLLVAVQAQSASSVTGASASSSSTIPEGLSLLTGLSSGAVTAVLTPTGSYISYESTITQASNQKLTGTLGTMSGTASSMAAGNMSTSSTTATQIVLSGRPRTTTAINGTMSSNATASSTSATPTATNTTPCNNYPEFCNRRYSNITYVAAHNSPFITPGNAASNQVYDVTTQLNDGIRLVQGQAHNRNGTIYLCHSSCDILNAGTLQSWLTAIFNWVAAHPYDVVTILIGNGDYGAVTTYVDPITASGLTQFAYIPPKIPMSLSDWPTLATMILAQQRVIIFMDYEADQKKVPYVLDEFSQVWETPFDPTNRGFPCTVQRPPGLSNADARNRLYMHNHNLNTEISLLGNSLLVPTRPLLNQTNNVTGFGSLGVAAAECAGNYGRAPNFLNVDYYNVGSGSVFEVAAKWNNVTYDRRCCGFAISAGERTRELVGRTWFVMCMLVLGASWLLV